MTSEAGKYLFRAANVWWRCAQYYVMAFVGWMPRDNRCMYMVHVCFSLGVLVAALVKIVFLSLQWSLFMYIRVHNTIFNIFLLLCSSSFQNDWVKSQ